MLTLPELEAALKRLADGGATDADRKSVGEAWAAGTIKVAPGERGVGVAGNVSGSVIITGDGNIVVQGAEAAAAIQKLLASMDRPGLERLRRGMSMAERPPDSFVPRLEEFNQLRTCLLDSASDQTVTLAAALCGAGGYGKTTLAKAFCWDPEVTERFSDSILWITLGQKPGDVINKVLNVLEYLTDKRPGYTDQGTALTRLREVLAGGRHLMVIDDVWNAARLMPFLEAGLNCSFLITTRISEVLPLSVRQVKVDAMKQEEASELLGKGLSTGAHEKEIRDLAKLLGEWPVLLKLVNSALRHRVRNANKPIGDALAWAREAYDRRGLTAFDTRDPEQREQAVAKTIDVSLGLLNAEESARYGELAVFPEDVDVPLATLEKYWRRTAGLDEFATEEVCVQLSRLSLVLDFNVGSSSIRLHDVMRKYLMDRGRDRLEGLHEQLLEAHRPMSGRWVDLGENEPYMWKHLAFHLLESKSAPELIETVKDLGYLARKTWVLDALRAEQDLRRAEEQAGDDAVLRVLRRSFAQSGHILNQLESENDVGATLHSRVHHIEDLGALAEKLAARLERPYLTSSCRLPDLPSPALVRTLSGHTAEVNGCAMSWDGKKIVSASYDHTLKVSDAETGAELKTLSGHTDSVTSCAMSRDGKKIVSASDDETLKVWDAETGAELKTLIGHTDRVNGCAMSGDGRKIVSASSDNTLKVWDAETGAELKTMRGHTFSVMACAMSADGKRVVSASTDKTLKVWDGETGADLKTLIGHTKSVTGCAMSGDGKRIISASADKTLKVWDGETGAEVKTLSGHTFVSGCVMSADGKRIVSALYDNTLKVWDGETGAELKTLRGHTRWVNACAMSGDGKKIVSASSDQTLKVWDAETGAEFKTLIAHTDRVNGCAMSGDGKTIVSASFDRTLKVWDAETGVELKTLSGHTDMVHGCALSADGRKIASASFDHTLKVWVVETGAELKTLRGHTALVLGCAMSEDGKRIVSASADHTLKVWDAETGAELETRTTHSGKVNGCAMSWDGKKIASASDDRTLKVWDAETCAELWTLSGHTDVVRGCAMSGDGKRIVSASEDNTLKVWDGETGVELKTLRGHTSWVLGCAMSGDGQKIVSASWDHTLKVWDVETAMCLATIAGDGPFRGCVISPDNTRVIAVGDGGVYFLRFVQ